MYDKKNIMINDGTHEIAYVSNDWSQQQYVGNIIQHTFILNQYRFCSKLKT